MGQLETSIVALCVKMPPVMLVSHRLLFQILAVPSLIKLLDNAPGKVVKGGSTACALNLCDRPG